MSEQDLLDQIQQLAGKPSIYYPSNDIGAINRHKDGRPDSGTLPHSLDMTHHPVSSYRGRGHPSRRPYQRTSHPSPLKHTASRGHPYSRGRASAPVSRHRTLVVSQPQPESTSTTMQEAGSSSSPQWVAKRDRHMQLINASVYEERAQARQNEILETKNKRLLERLGRRDKLERTKLYGFLKRKGQGNQVSVLGNLFRVTAQGNKLEKYQGPNLFCWGRC